MELFGGFKFCLGDWGQSQAWTVSVGADNLESSVGGFEVLSNIKSNQSCVISCEKVLGTFLEFPV
jgi:hypothetical protein